MDVRKKLVNFRKDWGVSMLDMAKRCSISEELLSMIESGAVTHPRIAKRIGVIYGLSELEVEELMPVIHRPHGDDFDPYRYATPDRMYNRDEKLTY